MGHVEISVFDTKSEKIFNYSNGYLGSKVRQQRIYPLVNLDL